MNAVRVLRALGPIDAANVRRDALLRWMLVLPPAFGLLFRGAAALAAEPLAAAGVAIADHQPLLASFLVLTTPMIYGVVVGFLLLDQRDDGTLTALRVTPLTPGAYLAYRAAIPVLLSVLMTPPVLALSGFSTLGVGSQLLAGVAAAPFAPVFALFMAACAKNKVQGFALMKAAGVVNWPPMIAWFVDGPWQLAFGLVPTYWPAKYYWSLEAAASGQWLYLLAGLVYLALLALALLRRFEKVVET
jgi:fluoroquinolone transport system permease protein